MRVTFLDGEERQKRTVVGRLGQFDEAADTLHIDEEDADRSHVVAVRDIQLARLEIEL